MTARSSIRIAAALFSVTACGGAVRPANPWAREHPSEWRLVLDDTDPARTLRRPEWSERCADDPQSGLVTLRYEAANTQIDLSFRCPVTDPATAEGLRSAFSHASLQHLPHGISVPDWEFVVRTPASNIFEGVDFDRVADGRLALTITTPLYALYGHSTLPTCRAPEDAEALPHCFVNWEHRIPLHLSMTVPYTPAAFDR